MARPRSSSDGTRIWSVGISFLTESTEATENCSVLSVLSVLSVRNRRCRSLDCARDDSEVQIPRLAALARDDSEVQIPRLAALARDDSSGAAPVRDDGALGIARCGGACVHEA